MELVTRFLVFRTLPAKQLSTVGDIGDFLNEKLESTHKLTKKQKDIEERAFRETFRTIFGELQGDGFRRYDARKNEWLGGFSISSFEVVALGVGYNISPKGTYDIPDGFDEKVKSIWSNQEFTSNSGSGVRASTRIPQIVPLGRRLFAS